MKRLLILIIILLVFPAISFADTRGPEEVVTEYFDRLYSGYLDLAPHDISDLMDMTSEEGTSFVSTYQMLVERRKYIEEMNYAYVERQRFPLELIIEEVEDLGDSARVTFYLDIDTSKAYPPFIYAGRNIFYLVKQEGLWKISERYHADINFSTSTVESYERRYSYEKSVELLQKSIDLEFMDKRRSDNNFLFPAYGLKSDPRLYGLKSNDYIYDPGRAIDYIDRHIYERNNQYASLQENCANFTSQVIYYGFFGEEYPYIGAWNSIDGDFTNNWVYVGLLRDYMTYPRTGNDIGPRSLAPTTIYGLNLGGIIEIKSFANESYAHTMQLWNYQKMIFSGNNYDGYRYYSDLLGYKRFYQPLFFRL